MQPKLSALACALSACLLCACSTTGQDGTVADPQEVARQIEQAKAEGGAYVRDDSALYQQWNRGGAAFRICEQTQVLYDSHHKGPSVRTATRPERTSEDEATVAARTSTGSVAVRSKKNRNRDRSFYSKRDKSVYAVRDRSVYSKKKPAAKKTTAAVPVPRVIEANPDSAVVRGPYCRWHPGMTREEAIKAGLILPSAPGKHNVIEDRPVDGKTNCVISSSGAEGSTPIPDSSTCGDGESC